MLIAEGTQVSEVAGGEVAVPPNAHYKLFLIRAVIRRFPDISRSDFRAISFKILELEGVYISPAECKSLIKRYRVLIAKPYYWPMFLSIISSFWLFYVSQLPLLVNFLLLIICFPLVFGVYFNFFVAFGLLYFKRKELVPAVHKINKSSGSVAIVIASRNEPFQVAKMTFDSAMELMYPTGMKEIIVVDNSDSNFSEYELWRDYVKSFQERSDIRVLFIHREGTVGFKPKNLDIALRHVAADYLLYLDVDSTLSEDSLLRTVPMFQLDSSLAFLQLQAVPANARGKSALALPQSIYNYFLRFGTVLLSHSSHTLFYGHNAIWRTHVVRELGDCLEYHRGEVVVTEDLSMSLRALFKGYYGVGVWVHSGEWVPESLRETEAMWLRWTVGTFQVYAKHWREISQLRKLKPREFWGWCLHIGTLINQGLIPIYVILGIYLSSPILMFLASISLLPEFLQAIFAFYKLRMSNMSRRKRFFVCYSGNLVLGSFLNWIRFIGLIRFVTRRRQGWVPTGKSSCGEVSFFRSIRERYGFILFGLSGISLSLYSFVYSSEGPISSVMILLCGLHGLHSIIAVTIFGRSTIQETVQDAVKLGHVNEYADFYD